MAKEATINAIASTSIHEDLSRGEHAITLPAACRESCVSRDGKPRSLPTLYRWATVGCKGVILETVVVGTRCTTRPALLRFIAAMTRAGGPRTYNRAEGR